MAEKVREADALSLKRWATGRTTSSNQWTLGCDVVTRSIAAVEQTMPAAVGEAKWTDRWIARCSSRRTKRNKNAT